MPVEPETKTLPNEVREWLQLENSRPIWSRLNKINTAGYARNLEGSKFRKYDIEVEGRLWSLWGNLHPEAPLFDEHSNGRQHLACCVMACCAADVFNLMDWNAQLLDAIVISGDAYFKSSIAKSEQKDNALSINDLNLNCSLQHLKFQVNIEHVVNGKLYRISKPNRMNFAEALQYFFRHHQYGVVQVHQRVLAIGYVHDFYGGYFMYDCQERDSPLFPNNQGASYMLRTRYLHVLLYCIVVTLNVPFYNVPFSIHKVDVVREQS